MSFAMSILCQLSRQMLFRRINIYWVRLLQGLLSQRSLLKLQEKKALLQFATVLQGRVMTS